MAYLQLNTKSLKHNFKYLDAIFKKDRKEWGVVTKLLCGNELFLKELLKLKPKTVLDSRLSNLKKIKEIDPSVETVYIKPVPQRSIDDLLAFADISFNTQFSTIKAINDRALKLGKRHQIVIMIEMGDLREGVMREDFIDFYDKVFNLKGVEVVGLGANLNCMNGIMPSHDKLIQMSLYEQLIEAKFNKKIKWVSAGTSISFPLLTKGLVPEGVNHFRIGETLYFGNDIVEHTNIPEMKQDVFLLKAEIIEIIEKPKNPTGLVGVNVAGEKPSFEIMDYKETSYRAILDIGLLDVDPKHLTIIDEDHDKYGLVGSSSDMIVIDVDENKANFKVGDLVSFKVDYMGALTLLNSKYIGKRII
ncbi:Predicted amino acid racemase [Zhouia amylolytica]|uniref:Predicted amino acid racemase n=2 Tax=Zhouia amylolytica TaxID=376730 RepID=A0A1I6VGR8_9FLAO|nr:alanine racemase [Zhouia amylolytica]ETN94494.1 putative amino acid racemase [Zhouia amylolytica AD3]MCQ0110278.1 alanine racemase [Zhouia amylolytica]SFT12913.1 Predicted amino acid racemase [Zhouia amylolytica]